MHYYQFNIGDYQSHTAHLSDIEDLAYRRLLDLSYLHEKPLPDDIDQIARLIRMRSHSDSIAVVLREYFVRTDEGWVNERVLREIELVNAKSQKARDSALARWQAKAMRTHSEGNATQDTIPITQDTEHKKKATDVAFVLPDWIPLETWNAFLEMRKRIKKPATEFAKKLIVGKLEKFKAQGQDVVSILEKSITSGWQDVFELKENKTFAQQAADIARVTVPGSTDPDPALLKIQQDRLKAVPPTLEQLEKMAALRRSIAK